MKKRLVKLVSVLLMLAVVSGLCACDEFDDYDDYDNGNVYEDDYDDDYDDSYDDESDEPAKAADGTVVVSDFNADQYPYYAVLSSKEKEVYSLLYEGLSQGGKKIDCQKANANEEQLTKAIDAVLNDHAELFWIDNQYEFTYDSDGGIIEDVTFDFFDFASTPEKLRDAKAAFEKAADDILAGIGSQQSAVEYERAIHDYICKNTAYDESAPYNQSAYSVIVLHKSVCAGYSKAFQYLLNKKGITCYYIPGTTTDSNIGGEDGAHAWNIIYLDGEYYNVDVLWDDSASETLEEDVYPFFNLTDSAFLYHTRDNLAQSLPKCTGTKYKYSNCFGKTVEVEELEFEDAA